MQFYANIAWQIVHFHIKKNPDTKYIVLASGFFLLYDSGHNRAEMPIIALAKHGIGGRFIIPTQ